MSSVTHELRTPLTSIRALAELMRRRPGRWTRRSASSSWRIIVAETERLTRLVNQVLDMAKIESGHAEWRNTDGRPARAAQRRRVQTTRETVPRARRRRRAASMPDAVPPAAGGPRPAAAGAAEPAVQRGQVRAAERGRVEVQARSRRHAARRSRCATTAPACPPSSSARVREVPPGRRCARTARRAPAWACRSAARSSSISAAGCGCAAIRARAPASASRCHGITGDQHHDQRAVAKMSTAVRSMRFPHEQTCPDRR